MRSNRPLLSVARLVAIVVGAWALGLSTGSHAAPITVPTGLDPGDQYRLAFLTLGLRDATSSDIADYDAFVNAQASMESALDGIAWQVIGSTASVSARDHTNTDPGSDQGVPIYLLDDTLLASDYADLWDGSIATRLQVHQNGSVFICPGSCEIPVSSTYVHTGSTAAGEIDVGLSLGAASGIVRDGSWQHSDGRWASYVEESSSNPHKFYAISEVLTVSLPEPGTAALLALGVAALLLPIRRVTLAPPGGRKGAEVASDRFLG